MFFMLAKNVTKRFGCQQERNAEGKIAFCDYKLCCSGWCDNIIDPQFTNVFKSSYAPMWASSVGSNDLELNGEDISVMISTFSPSILAFLQKKMQQCPFHNKMKRSLSLVQFRVSANGFLITSA